MSGWEEDGCNANRRLQVPQNSPQHKLRETKRRAAEQFAGRSERSPTESLRDQSMVDGRGPLRYGWPSYRKYGENEQGGCGPITC